MDWVKPLIELIVEHWDALVTRIERLIAPWFWRPIIGPDGQRIGDLKTLMLFVSTFVAAILAVIVFLVLSRDFLGNNLGSLLGVFAGACATWYTFWKWLRFRLIAPRLVKIGRTTAYLGGVLLDRLVAPPLTIASAYLVGACLLSLALLPVKTNN